MTPSSPPSAPLILASASPRRQALLRQAGIAFSVKVSDYQEGNPLGSPRVFVQQAAQGKARAVAEKLRSAAWVVGADTLVVRGQHCFGKPRNREDARRMLQTLSGKEHQVLTGVSLLHSRCSTEIHWVEQTRVFMRHISEQELEGYLKAKDWQDKAGAYGIQGRAGAFVKRVDGCYFNVVGLPLGSLCAKLAKLGIYPC